MKQNKWVCGIGFLWISVLGVLLHFTYAWSGKNAFVGLFSAVNESSWEHLKLLFFPAVLYGLLLWLLLHRKYPAVLTAFVTAALSGMLAILMLFYTLQGILGSTPDWLNIGIFLFAAAWTACLGTHWMVRWKSCSSLWGLALLTLFSILFFRFTTQPPTLALFVSPV